MSPRTQELIDAGMQFRDEMPEDVVAAIDHMSQAEFDSLVAYTKAPEPTSTRQGYVAFETRQGAE